MLIPTIAEFFRHKVVGSVIVLVCWSSYDEVKFSKQLSQHGMKTTISCDPSILDVVSSYHFQGVLYFVQEQYNILEQVKRTHFAHNYKWLIINSSTIEPFNTTRYDADITIIREEEPSLNTNATQGALRSSSTIFLDDIYVHPRDGASSHEWARWSPTSGFHVTHDRERILRRKDLKEYPFRIAAPVAHYTEDSYNGPFSEYLVDLTVPDPGLRSGYGVSALLVEAVKAKEVLLPVQYWVAAEENSTLLSVASGSAEVTGAVLLMHNKRLQYMDYILPIWMLHVGFTYLAERESSSNMYVEPFTAAVWWSCLGVGIILAFAQRVSSRNRHEKDGACIAVLATWLQQDADAVPQGISGRWTFTVLSICSMLVHAYYTSAIVSALMSTGRGGPKTLTALADSRYAIASADHEFIRNTMFNVKTNWTAMEYLKKKKMTSKFYQDIKYGVQLIKEGSTAYHAEYHEIYYYKSTLSDTEICKMQHVDTVTPMLTWVGTTARGQWTNILKTAGAWLYETGLARRHIDRMQIKPPACRMSLLAERVTFWDVAPLLLLTTLGAVASLALLGLEIVVAKYADPRKRLVRAQSSISQEKLTTVD